jgi:hypothetical protein
MLQLIALLAISWFIIWLFDKGSLSVLGLLLTKERLKYFAILFIVSALISSSAFLLKMYVAKEEYQLSQSLTIKSIFLEILYQFRSVLTEELLCRGVLLYILIKKIGQTKAVLISSILFAVLHWFNAGIWGNIIQMFVVFGFTFAMGILLAYAYAKTFSLWVPFAIHFGWNLTQNFIFPDTSTGNHIFILAAPPPLITVSYLAFFTMLLFPKIAVIVIDYLIVKRIDKNRIT